ncbi:MAG: hypothetical protein RR764_09355 [Oscillospiraceae bacterium]
MNNTRNIAPPKLQRKLLLGGLSLSEIAIAGVLAIFGFFSSSMLNSLYWTALWLLFTARLYKGKSIASLLKVAICYHITAQQFTRRVSYNEKRRSNGKSRSI